MRSQPVGDSVQRVEGHEPREGRETPMPNAESSSQGRDPRDVAICRYLETHDIPYQRFDHELVYTCEEADRFVPAAAVGVQTKNLFVRDKRGRRHLLIVTSCAKAVDLKATAGALGADSLSLGSPERLMTHLGVSPGSVTLLALAHDGSSSVELVVDSDVWTGEALRCHPMVNSATLLLSHDAARRFIETTGHSLHVVKVPAIVRAPSDS
ncbi:MAG: prolyl-tRNA synthetase associated domain-containing protein [Gemmatimonadaceae bacterium]